MGRSAVVLAFVLLCAVPAFSQTSGFESGSSTGGRLGGSAGSYTSLATNADAVTAVQQRLAEAGYDPGPIDGVEGPGTQAAIAAWQADRGLPHTGVVSPTLLAEMTPTAMETSSDYPVSPPPSRAVPLQSMVGKPAHAIAGDRVGWVREVRQGADGRPTEIVLAVDDLYGHELGRLAIPWSLVDEDLGQATVLLPLTGWETRRAAAGLPVNLSDRPLHTSRSNATIAR